MFKKSAILLLCVLLTFCVGCSKQEPLISVDEETPSSSEEPVVEPIYYTNPLTGVKNLSSEKSKQQPVAIMINNIDFAQKVQTGVNKADIVYETEVEGGITRLMAVFQDVESVGRIGTIRSARYAYVDLALGHGAVYLHHGQDNTYCKPHLRDIEHYTVDTNNCGKRISNGLSREHTLYTDGAGIYKSFMKNKTVEDATMWQNFADEETSVSLNGGTANKVTVNFSTSYNTGFKYDAATGRYSRLFRGNLVKDYVTGETTQVKNVFVLLTSISNYSDGYHRYIDLQGGDGYYFVNGTYTPIKWTKGKSTNSIKLTNTDGTTLTVNQGNSWVCIASKANKIGIE